MWYIEQVACIEIIAQMQRKHGNGIAITASTGIAACNIGGLTLHSFAGIGLGHDSVEKLVKRISSVKQIYQRWTTISVLIIDESKCCIVTKCYGRISRLMKSELFSFYD
jgi:PIF1-like helicase